jgi:ABC-type phosphate transport system substrate-binding protein
MKHFTQHLRGIASASVVLLFCAGAHAADVVAVMATGSPALTKDQVAALYLGRSTDLKPVDLPEGSPARDDFYKKSTDRDAAQVKAVWSRIVFTGKGQPPKEVPDAAAVKKAVAADPKAVGYVDKAAVDGSVKVVLSLD